MNDRQKTVLIRWCVMGVGILLFIILVAQGISNLGKQKIDTTEGLAIIQKAESADVTTIENKIAGLEGNYVSYDEEDVVDTRSVKEKFDSSVIMGDSIALGFSEYGILNSSSVVAEIGAKITDEDSVKEQIEKAKEMNPQMLFLCYGINDIRGGNATIDEFLDSYKEIIDYIKEELPDTKIFVNSIFPVDESLIKEETKLADIEQYNEELRAVCDKKQIAFLDNTDLIEDSYYEEDGIHFVTEFYNIWAANIAEVAEL